MLTLTRGRDNLALTVMMPASCKAKCEFCTVRDLYTERVSNHARLWNQFELLVSQECWPTKELKLQDIVFSGGEPLYSILLLHKMVVLAKDKGFNVYINTILPDIGADTQGKDQYWSAVLDLALGVDGFNVSRHGSNHQQDCYSHFGTPVVSDASIGQLARMTKVRINSIAKPNGSFGFVTQVDGYSQRWGSIFATGGDIELAIRLNYEGVAVDNNRRSPCKLPVPLVQNRDVIPVLERVGQFGQPAYMFLDHVRCAVCETLKFQMPDGFKFQIHQGSKLSHRMLGSGEVEVNDLILMHDGTLCYDWDFEYTLQPQPAAEVNPTFNQLMDDVWLAQTAHSFDSPFDNPLEVAKRLQKGIEKVWAKSIPEDSISDLEQSMAELKARLDRLEHPISTYTPGGCGNQYYSGCG